MVLLSSFERGRRVHERELYRYSQRKGNKRAIFIVESRIWCQASISGSGSCRSLIQRGDWSPRGEESGEETWWSRRDPLLSLVLPCAHHSTTRKRRTGHRLCGGRNAGQWGECRPRNRPRGPCSVGRQREAPDLGGAQAIRARSSVPGSKTLFLTLSS